MSRALRLIPVLLAAFTAQAATLVQLSLDQMTQNATAIVRARIIGASASISGTTIYTHYQLATSEIWKGTAPTEVALPGGDIGSRKQTFPGVPELHVGSEYVLFLWKSPTTGTVHALGLSQGIFDVATPIGGSLTASRRASGELMLDATGRRVSDQPVSMPLTDMKARVRGGAPVQ